MDWQIVWTDPAAVAFEEAIRYIAEQNPAAADAMRISILDRVQNLAQFPFIGPKYEPDLSGRVREIVCSPYRIFYRVDEPSKTIEVLTVWHSSRMEPKLPNRSRSGSH